MKKLIPIILFTLIFSGLTFLTFKIVTTPPVQVEFHCYTDDTLTWRAVGVSRQQAWCEAGTCRIGMTDSPSPVYYHPAEREYCHEVTIQ